jgi:16S rRNA (cytidine1402-2'-O)-methyltransferase
MPGSLVLVATPIGNLEDITLRALRALKEADLIAAEDTRRTARLLDHYGIATPTTSLHEHNERGRLPGLLDRIRRGDTIAVVTDAGMPGISDPGFLAVRQAIEAGLPVEVVPGVSALTTAIAGSGLASERVTFLGFAPHRAGERRRWLEKERGTLGTLVLFEAPSRVAGLLRDAADILGDRTAVVARELTKLHESWTRGSLGELAAAAESGAIPQRGEFVILVSDQIAGSAPTVDRISDEDVAEAFSVLQATGALNRRAALAAVADRFGISTRSAYAIIEKHKNSAK